MGLINLAAEGSGAAVGVSLRSSVLEVLFGMFGWFCPSRVDVSNRSSGGFGGQVKGRRRRVGETDMKNPMSSNFYRLCRTIIV